MIATGLKGPLGALGYATVLCDDIERSVAFYRDLLGYVEVQGVAGRLPTSLPTSQPPGAEVLLGSPGERLGLLHLVSSARIGPAAPLRARGWSTLEFIVSDLEAVAAHARAVDAVVVTPPSVAGATGNLGVFHVAGPNGEIVYLTQILRRHDRYTLPPTPSTLVGRLFIAVWSTSALEDDRRWIEGHFDVVRVSDRMARLRAVNRFRDRPAEDEYRISSLSTGGGSLIEIDEVDGLEHQKFPDGQGSVTEHSLPAGVHSVTFVAEGIDGPPHALRTITSNLEVEPT